jgi:hypothetical protein
MLSPSSFISRNKPYLLENEIIKTEMKKAFKVAAIAVAVSLAFVACKNNKVEEEVVDTNAIEQVVADVNEEATDIIDTVAAVVEEEAPAAATKTTQKKAAVKETPTKSAETSEVKGSKNNGIGEDAIKADEANGENTTTMKRRR